MKSALMGLYMLDTLASVSPLVSYPNCVPFFQPFAGSLAQASSSGEHLYWALLTTGR